jgi:hypothetical protein
MAGCARVIRGHLKSLPKAVVVEDDETTTTHRTNDDGEDIIELD